MPGSTYIKSLIAGITLCFIFFSKSVSAQTCGFGCLGLGGFYAGYSVEKFDAPGLNEFVTLINSSRTSTVVEPLKKFGQAKGFRLGANIFRTKSEGFLFSVKGYYQFMKEDQKLVESVDNKNVTTDYSLNLNYWGVGVDLGFTLFSIIDWKVVDAQVTFHSLTLDTQRNPSPAGFTPDQYTNADRSIGYSVGSGLIFRLVGHYISLETTAGYNNFSVDEVKDQNEKLLNMKNIVNKGGFYGTVQLNVGIPLY